MAWLVATLSLIVIWVASIFKVFFGATSSSKAAVLDDGNKKNVLFVIAHPDDESMFFSPTINYLASSGYNLHMLCFSTGNADGMGSIRKDELHQACAVLRVLSKLSKKGSMIILLVIEVKKVFLLIYISNVMQVPLEQLKVLDHPNLQDGFGQVWSHDLLAKVIGEEVSNHDIHTIITFDNYGVSGHCNHRDVHHGVLKFLQTNSERNIKAWELASLNIFRKYSGPIDIWLSIFSSKRNPSKAIIINEQPWKSYKAMAQHLSQWVWFRKLFVSFSSYTYANTLDRINT
ncbi:PREDICTED: probable N-acetylglucosaminyl-phosphatidylinositol de-N-acetylase isoform X1 [Brassica oleracea var. oleracea]|uniref:probable N-acetylglucosaminyl-phosphatidylinositol de-N-acetylase isoform X1 n=1 Tax=Brassica oleracea var. oleracea TaxID=109376 RepID=UPI0006A6F519|nr:PREDICTED: probable N-acetylglucosaminyl-phosphatidylinositol de-N-acetylase isoform X1 [Brassica oleracea var. oleracea]